MTASLLFGAASVVAGQLDLLDIPTQFVYMVPPAATIAALVLFNLHRERQDRRALNRATARLRSPNAVPLAAPLERTPHR